MVFDDCYEHEVWNKTEKERVLLLFDLWHPELEPEVSKGTMHHTVHPQRTGIGVVQMYPKLRTPQPATGLYFTSVLVLGCLHGLVRSMC